jgi:hypothetical protein
LPPRISELNLHRRYKDDEPGRQVYDTSTATTCSCEYAPTAEHINISLGQEAIRSITFTQGRQATMVAEVILWASVACSSSSANRENRQAWSIIIPEQGDLGKCSHD